MRVRSLVRKISPYYLISNEDAAVLRLLSVYPSFFAPVFSLCCSLQILRFGPLRSNQRTPQLSLLFSKIKIYSSWAHAAPTSCVEASLRQASMCVIQLSKTWVS